MSALRLSVARKLGSIVYGLLAGFATAMVFTIASVFLIALVSWFLKYTNWGPPEEWSWPLGIVVAYYAFLPGAIVGAVVCWKVWRSGFRRGSVP
jgi:membrane protein YdbS with pleckstrin-like domain